VYDGRPYAEIIIVDVVWLIGVLLPRRTVVACQRQHWTSHKRQCRALAQDEFCSTFGRYSRAEQERILSDPTPSELSLVLKLSAITWTLRPLANHVHIVSLNSRASLLDEGTPVPGDTKEKLSRLLKRAVTELPWPELSGGVHEMRGAYFRALTTLAYFGEPEVAVEISSRHVEDLERHVVTPDFVATVHICRLDLLLAAAWKNKDDEDKRGAYQREAKGLMERVTRSLPGSPRQEWDFLVSHHQQTC
jgi:hypothetical protein